MIKKEAEVKRVFEIKKINVLAIGKVFALLGAFAGFILGLIISVLIYRVSSMPNVQEIAGLSQVTASQLIVLPFQYLIFSCIIWGAGSMLLALIYNLIAKSGGLKFNVK